MRRSARSARAARVALVVLVVAVAVGVVTVAPASAGGSRAVVIVDTGSGTVTRVISFDGTISGYEALELAGANPATYGFAGQGAAVCQLFGVGHPAADDCLGTADDPRYWAYYRAPAGAGGWQYSRAGAGATTVADGDVEGWRFGAGGAPGFRAFCDVAGCAAPAAPEPAASPPGPVAGGTSTDAGGAPATAPGATASPAAGGDGSAGPTAEPTPPTTGAASTGDGSGRRAPTRVGDRQALGDRPVVATDDDGAGSPVGVLVAAGLVALLAAGAVVLRRRSRAAD